MEVSQLRALLALRDLASFTRAGEQLHLSPPAVFGQIRQLEDQIGLRVYERIGKRLLLTRACPICSGPHNCKASQADYRTCLVIRNDLLLAKRVPIILPVSSRA